MMVKICFKDGSKTVVNTYVIIS